MFCIQRPLPVNTEKKRSTFTETKYCQQFCINVVNPTVAAVFHNKLLTHLRICFSKMEYLYELREEESSDWVTYLPNNTTLFTSTCGWKIDGLLPAYGSGKLLASRSDNDIVKVGDLFDELLRPAQCPKSGKYGMVFVNIRKKYLHRINSIYPAISC